MLPKALPYFTMIRYFNDDHPYRLRHKKIVSSWLINTAQNEGYEISDLNIIFCSDNQLLTVNQEHLNHDYFTDIITFDYTEEKSIEGEIYISVDRVKDNAKKEAASFVSEMHRVLVHGVLHLCGFKDKSPKDAKIMREKENHHLSRLKLD